MPDTVIKVENLGKLYRIGSGDTGYKTFRETIVDSTKAPFLRLQSAFKHLTNLTNKTNKTNLTNSTNSTNETNQTGDNDLFWALRDVSFEVKQGEVVGIIGRNGAGKSTLLKILSKITDPTEGRVELKGRIGSLLEVGTGFHPELTGHENVYLYGAILGMDRWEITRKFDEIIAFAELDKFVDTPVKRYSSGMYMRLAFAVAAHLEPEILLVDEVLAVGDAAFQKKCLGKMGDVSKEGRTILFVSHNMGAIATLCGRSVLLHKGEINKIDKTSSVVSYYLTDDNRHPTSGSLYDHPNRAKGFKQLLTRFVLQMDNDVVYYGKSLQFRIAYSFPDKIAVPQFCASFHNEHGVAVFTVISDYQNNDIPGSLQGEGEIMCRIKSLPLLPGNYFVNLRLWQPGQKLDDIENVARFRVEWLDRDIGQFNWDTNMGVVYVDAEWHLNNDKEN